jgi:hypothetical protein
MRVKVLVIALEVRDEATCFTGGLFFFIFLNC